jgi:hypothetical protein
MTDAGRPGGKPSAPVPGPRLVVDHVATWETRPGRPRVVLVVSRGTDPQRLVVHPATRPRWIALETAAAYRVLGVPAVPTWSAVVGEDVRDERGNVVLPAGKQVEVGARG